MNRSINILLLFFSFPAFAFIICIAFDIHFFNIPLAESPFKIHIFVGFAMLLLLLIIRRSTSRWVGVFMTRKPERFIWSTPVSAERKKQVRLFLLLETVIALFAAATALLLTEESWPIAAVYGLMVLDQLLFLALTQSWFRVGITHKAVVVADREVRLLFFSGLRRVETHQQTLYFEYIEDLQLFFPVNCIPKGKYGEFRAAMEERVDRDRVFFSEGFKALN
ncbi:hypothetical protein [Fluviicola sp.]|jgi:hypothetical protein|uniref:hypothetical protein n=1 Tax=Fluviicola sp. TaxID=1917219 RepID=UPI002836D713|nr:hypothetical protein [Fluviicola sp.]MDR0801365.1 hypothetical protein [Fluviicola sp.]